MPELIKVHLDMADVQARLQGLQGKLHNRRPFMKAVKNIMQNAVEENFAQEGRPKWTPLRAATLARRGNKGDGKILQVTGRLVNSIMGRYDDNSAIVGTNVRYAAIHQFGGTIKQKARTGVVHYFQRHGNGQRFSRENGAHYGMKRDHKAYSITMPARPFLALTTEDKEQIRAAAITYLEAKP